MTAKTRITVARHAGFCPGVKMAIDKTLEINEKTGKKIYTLGPLIHNRQVMETIKQKNVFSVSDVSEIKENGATVVIRAHGISPRVEKAIRSRKNLVIIDATCPLVKKVHSNIKRWTAEGYATVIVGDKNHAEVTGLAGCAGEKHYVVSGPEEAAKLPPLGKVNVVAQTTQEEDNFRKTAEIVRKKSKKTVISDTICEPTKTRQKETKIMSEKADLVIVVGGKNSANTRRLHRICSGISKKAVLVETDEDLSKEDLKNRREVFITAGASTPNWMIEKVFRKAEKLTRPAGNVPARFLSFAWNLAVTSSMLTAASAMCLTYMAMRFQDLEIKLNFIFLSGLFVGSLHLLNRIEEKGAKVPDEVQKLLFTKLKKASKFLAVALGVATIFTSLTLGIPIFALTLILWFLGSSYPDKSKRFSGFFNFAGSKDIVTSLGWGFVCAAVPAISNASLFDRSSLFTLAFCILTAFVRSTFIGISNVHNDMIIGKENFYKAAGPGWTYAVIFLIFILLESLLFSLSTLGYRRQVFQTVFYSLFYYLVLSLIFLSGKVPRRVVSETAIDFQFILIWAVLAFGQ